MKIKPQHQLYIESKIRETVEKIDPVKLAKFRAAVSDKRYRSELLWGAQLSAYICDFIYPYADDTHIDTALRHIISKLDEEKR